MIIKTLVEDTSLSKDFEYEHGLSLYIETKKHKILFDLGKTDLFLQNAKKLDVDIKSIDLVVISHGHYDHGGGLETFLKENTLAKIYIHKEAFDKYYSKKADGNKRYIGLDKKLESNNRFIFTEDYLYIDEELELFSNIKSKELISQANKSLFLKDGEVFKQDTFSHEQNLIISQGDKTLLIGGCAHKGIVNIIKEFMDLKDKAPTCVISGFHLFSYSSNKSEDPSLVDSIADFMLESGSLYYTGHCTGLDAFEQLKVKMKDKLEYLSTGSVIEI